jgi:hypothetical protein
MPVIDTDTDKLSVFRLLDNLLALAAFTTIASVVFYVR